MASSSPLSARLKQIRKFRPFADILFGVLLRRPSPKSFVHLPRYYPASNNILHTKYSAHLETQFFLALVSPVEGTETGLTGGEEKDKIQNGGLK